MMGDSSECDEIRGDSLQRDVDADKASSWVHVAQERSGDVDEGGAGDEDESTVGSSDSVSILGESEIEEEIGDGDRLATEGDQPVPVRSVGSDVMADDGLKLLLNVALLIAVVLDVGMCAAYAAGWSEESNVVAVILKSIQSCQGPIEADKSLQRIESLIAQNTLLSERVADLESEITRMQSSFVEKIAALEQKLENLTDEQSKRSIFSESWKTLKEKLPERPDMSHISSSVAGLLDGIRAKVSEGQATGQEESMAEATKRILTDGAEKVTAYAADLKDVTSIAADYAKSQSGKLMANLVDRMKSFPNVVSGTWWSGHEEAADGARRGDPLPLKDEVIATSKDDPREESLLP